MEKWKDIKDYDGRYSISNYGRVRTNAKEFNSYNQFGNHIRTTKDRILCIKVVKNGYAQVGLRHPVTSKKTFYLIHRLVLIYFKPHKHMKDLQVNHKDAVKLNNHIDNLEWVTPMENKLHAMKMGLTPRGEAIGKGKLVSENIPVIREMLSQGIPSRTIGKQFNVNKSTILCIKWDRTWCHIPHTKC